MITTARTSEATELELDDQTTVIRNSINDDDQIALVKSNVDPVSKPFFLTRNTVNLMKDLDREMLESAGIFVIYGDEGVGRSHLLEELAFNRLVGCTIRRLNLIIYGNPHEVVASTTQSILRAFANSEPGDVIIADDFDKAHSRIQHQLLMSWSDAGLEKNIYLIISCSTAMANEIKLLGKQYKLRVRSFQQMPFSAEEAHGFLSFYLFPDQPVERLVMDRWLHKKLVNTRGNAAEIVKIAVHAGDVITRQADQKSEPVEPPNRTITAKAAEMIERAVDIITRYANRKPEPVKRTNRPVSALEAVIAENAEDAREAITRQADRKPGPVKRPNRPVSALEEEMARRARDAITRQADRKPGPVERPNRPVSALEEELARRSDNVVTRQADRSPEPDKRPNQTIPALVAACLVVAVVGWYYVDSQLSPSGLAISPEVPDIEDTSPKVVVAKAAVKPEPEPTELQPVTDAPEPAVETGVEEAVANPDSVAVVAVTEEAEISDQPVTSQADDSAPMTNDQPVPLPAENETAAVVEVEPENPPVSESPIEVASSDAVEAGSVKPKVELTEEHGWVTESDVVEFEQTAPDGLATTREEETKISDPPAQASTRLQGDLRASLDWINSLEAQTGTLQIMLVPVDRFSEGNFYRYVDKLAGQGVDVSRVRIIESYSVNQRAFSVVYGEYPSRTLASRARKDLPPALQEAEPIARSAGGLLREIRRLVSSL